jgi:uncharacterized membrane protein YfcA
MLSFGYPEYVIIALAILGSSVIKNGVGVGAGMFLLPFLALVLPPKFALGFGAPVMLVSDVVGVRNYWKEWDKNYLLLLLPSAFFGVMFGAFFVKIIPSETFKFWVGLLAVVFSGYQLLKMIFSRKMAFTAPSPLASSRKKSLTLLFGFFGGLASTVAHAGGMVMSIYLIKTPTGKRAFVGTLVLFFAVINSLKLATYLKIGILTGGTILFVAITSPIIILGGLLGNALNKRISQDLFRGIVLALIFLIGARLLFSA